MKILKIFLLLISLVQQGFSVIVIDFDKFDLDKDKKGIRMIQFDVDSQKIQKIEYFPYEEIENGIIGLNDKMEKCENGDYLTCNLSDFKKDQKSFKELTITASKQFDFSKYGIVAQEIDVAEKPTDIEIYNVFTNLKYAGKKFNSNKDENYIASFKAFFEKFSKKVDDGDCPVACYQFLSLNSLYSGEKGIIGERITELTMYSFGFNRLQSKYEDNHGFDGIFENKTNEVLCLTESKYKGGVRDDKKKILDNLNYKNIKEKIDKMKQNTETKNTSEVLEKYTEDASCKLFKFLHITKPIGKLKCFLEQFDKKEVILDMFKNLKIIKEDDKQDNKIEQATLRMLSILGFKTEGLKLEFQ